MTDRFESGVDAWKSGLGLVRDEVRQELVRRQLAAHLPEAGTSWRVLDAGCGQGTQAVVLARLGHNVRGIDLSESLLDEARRARAGQPEDVQDRLKFEIEDLLAMEGNEHYDLVCCHGVAMYLRSLSEVVQALTQASKVGGIVSILTRNRAGVAMRAGTTGDWAGAMSGFDARHYVNRVGIQGVRADEPAEVRDALTNAGATVEAWYGVRLFTDHWGPERPGADFAQLVAAEEEAGRRDPYRQLAALTHTVARFSG